MKPLARGGDFWSGLVLAALGAWIVSEAHGWDYMTEEGPGPGFFPMWYGSVMVVLSLVLVARTAFGGVSREAKAPPNWPEIRRALTCWAAFVACVALMNVLGFTVSFALLTWFIVAYMARRPHPEALAISVVGAASFYGLFSYLLDLSLPSGLLF
ncbi:MAG TPA: tripartite tricarboxylate transporter TctB family protein [Usitatibacter sp.]|jgi:putative tricarboxylic transport membrane protein|nr:tripartite tricarboxylate transporter TctB family protein [Usitatibacter sp.]